MMTWMDKMREDVNNEEGIFAKIATNITSILFKGVMILAVPIFIYLFLEII
ncbi:MAG TPA: hypothetical protein VEV44_00015 [Pseudoneobacillus sp.]|nr:hypothetical protein [Pseudoneobacillus sp.]